MQSTQAEFTASEDEEIINIEDDKIEKRDGFFGPPQPFTEEYHIENQIDLSDTGPNPYPKA
jgi:hypothetical protein